MNDETEYLAKAISKLRTEVQLVSSLLLIVDARREKLIKETAKQKKLQLGELEILGLSILQKNAKASSEENTKDINEQPFDKMIMGVTHVLNEPSQQKPGK